MTEFKITKKDKTYGNVMEYNGAYIMPADYGKGYQWIHDNYYDCEWTGDSWSSTGCGAGNDVQECMDDIDEFLESKGK